MRRSARCCPARNRPPDLMPSGRFRSGRESGLNSSGLAPAGRRPRRPLDMLDRTRALSTSIVLFALAFAAAAPAAAWDVRRDATEADFTDFARRFASAAYAYPRHPAGPLGVVGFEVFGGAVDGDLDGGFLSIARAGVRKGLPGGVDLGVSVGEAVGTDLKFGTAEIQWAFVKGGALSPAVALRVTGT